MTSQSYAFLIQVSKPLLPLHAEFLGELALQNIEGGKQNKTVA
jgi:hypothetical protein